MKSSQSAPVQNLPQSHLRWPVCCCLLVEALPPFRQTFSRTGKPGGNDDCYEFCRMRLGRIGVGGGESYFKQYPFGPWHSKLRNSALELCDAACPFRRRGRVQGSSFPCWEEKQGESWRAWLQDKMRSVAFSLPTHRRKMMTSGIKPSCFLSAKPFLPGTPEGRNRAVLDVPDKWAISCNKVLTRFHQQTIKKNRKP